MEKPDLGSKRRHQKDVTCFTYSKSTFAFLIIALLLLSCSSQKTKSFGENDPVELVHFDSLEGEVHQLTIQGSSSDLSFSPIFNQLAFVHDDPQSHKTPQIYMKNMIDKTERRLTFNLGENFHPQFHPYKRWIVYSSSAGNVVEKINVAPVLKDLGLNPTAQAAKKSFDVYVLNEDGSDLRRITHDKAVNSLATFSRDGEKVIYVSQNEKNSQVVQHDMRNGQKKILVTSQDPITSLSVAQDFVAYTTEKKLVVQKIKGQANVYEGPDGFYFSDVSLHPQENRLLVISNLEDKNNKDVYLLDLNKKCATRLTFHPGDESAPSFGPEGKSLFFVSNRSQVNQVYATMIRDSLSCKTLP